MAQQELEMWKMILVATMCVGCVAGGERAAVQEVTGVTVAVRDAGQLAVSWTADPLASRYLVFQSADGALPALVATVFDSGGGAPSTSWIATGLTAGVEYCYSIRSGFADGGVGAPGASACGPATGITPSVDASTITVPPTSFASATPFAGATWSFTVGPNAMQSNTNGILVGGLPSHPGDIVRAFTIPVCGVPAGSHLVIAAKVADGSMSETVIGSVVVATTSSWVPVVLDVTDTTIPPNGAVTMIFTADSAGIAIGNIAMRYTPGR